MKAELCKAFCDEITVRQVPFGLAVSTSFDGPMGDRIGFYVSNPDQQGQCWVQDDGMTIFSLESAGADLGVASRLEALNDLLAEYGFHYDDEEHVLRSSLLPASGVAKSALNFVAFMLRVQDVALLSRERAAATFRDEVIRKIRERIGSKAKIYEKAPVSPQFDQYIADVVLTAPNRIPVALYIGSTDAVLSEAIILQLVTRYEAEIRCSVIALVESQAKISKKSYQRATNRLTAVAQYRGDEKAAIDRVVSEVLGAPA